MMASPGFGNPPVTFFEWDGQSLTAVAGTPNAPIDGSYYGNMLVLPTGQILLNSVWFDVPSNQETGRSKLEVVASGIASQPVFVTVGGRGNE
jgi:hypothetical protein